MGFQGPLPLNSKMKITPEQARSTAAILYPEEYATNRINAIIKALAWLREIDEQTAPAEIMAPPVEDYQERKDQTRAVMKRLNAHMKAEGITANQLAAELEVNPATLRTWLQGSYIPRGESMQKLTAFLEKIGP
jgi:ribosome-binding protein aMBF1 (putative translation factor)